MLLAESELVFGAPGGSLAVSDASGMTCDTGKQGNMTPTTVTRERAQGLHDPLVLVGYSQFIEMHINSLQ